MLTARLAWHEKAIWMLRALDAGYEGGAGASGPLHS
jgi:hypothetical protein